MKQVRQRCFGKTAFYRFVQCIDYKQFLNAVQLQGLQNSKLRLYSVHYSDIVVDFLYY